jgi:hypothetical protein
MHPDTPIFAVYDSLEDAWFVVSEDVWSDLALLSDEGDEDDE